MTDLPFYSAGPSAAFFDLDRTLISGSSAFVLGIAAWRGKLVPTHQFLRDAAGAVMFKFAGASPSETPLPRNTRNSSGVNIDE